MPYVEWLGAVATVRGIQAQLVAEGFTTFQVRSERAFRLLQHDRKPAMAGLILGKMAEQMLGYPRMKGRIQMLAGVLAEFAAVEDELAGHPEPGPQS